MSAFEYQQGQILAVPAHNVRTDANGTVSIDFSDSECTQTYHSIALAKEAVGEKNHVYLGVLCSDRSMRLEHEVVRTGIPHCMHGYKHVKSV